MLIDFENILFNNNNDFEFPKYAFNLNYIAISFFSIVKLISINEDFVENLVFHKDIDLIIESNLTLYIIINDTKNPEFFRVIEGNPNNLANVIKKEKIFENEGEISHYLKYDNLHLFLNNINTEKSEAVIFINGQAKNITDELNCSGINIKNC